MSLSNRSSWTTFHKKTKEFSLWLILGVVLSLLIHFFIFKKIGCYEIASFNPASFDSIIPRKFHLERVEVDPKLLEEPEKKKPIALLKPVEVSLEEKKNFLEPVQEYDVKPGIIDTKKISEEKPAALIEKNLIPETLQQPNQPLISFEEREHSLDNLITNQINGIGNYSQLDQLIEQKTSLSSETAPILLPTDLLFEYDADQLKPEAEKSLEKLALLIQRNPKAQFIIEGFTDSFGSDAYNLDLSSRRANSIKQWLITKQSIDPNQIQAYGLGKSHFLVPSTGSIEEQGLNRRVEIVIRKK